MLILLVVDKKDRDVDEKTYCGYAGLEIVVGFLCWNVVLNFDEILYGLQGGYL